VPAIAGWATTFRAPNHHLRSAERGVLDRSVVIDLDRIDVSMLPSEVAVTAIAMAELAAGPTLPRIQRSEHGDKIVCSGLRPPSPRCRSTLMRLGRTGASMQQSRQRVARHEAHVRST
jgi:hypothetical protein